MPQPSNRFASGWIDVVHKRAEEASYCSLLETEELAGRVTQARERLRRCLVSPGHCAIDCFEGGLTPCLVGATSPSWPVTVFIMEKRHRFSAGTDRAHALPRAAICDASIAQITRSIVAHVAESLGSRVGRNDGEPAVTSMDQSRPCWKAFEYPRLDRRSQEEI